MPTWGGVVSNYPRVSRGEMAADVLQRDFTQIHNRLFRDPRLSFKAKGVFGLISTHRDGYGVTPEWIAGASTDGVSAVKTALRELEQFGYLERHQERTADGRVGIMTYRITDMPRSGPVSENPPPVMTCDDAEHALRQDESETRRSGPLVDFPPAVYPPAADRTHKKTSTKNTGTDEDEKTAPSARSAPDAGGSTSGSRDRATSGCAAPAQPQRLTIEQKQAVQRVRDLLPREFDRALPARTPRAVADAVLDALAAATPSSRTPEQLVQYRVMARWDGFWAPKFLAGEVDSPIGVLRALLAPAGRDHDRCDERINVDTGELCVPCQMRAADRQVGAALPLPRPEPAASPVNSSTVPPQDHPQAASGRLDAALARQECACGNPLILSSSEGICGACRADTSQNVPGCVLLTQPMPAPAHAQ